MEAAYFETSPSLEGGSSYGHSELDTSNFFGAPTTHQQQPALAADELWQAPADFGAAPQPAAADAWPPLEAMELRCVGASETFVDLAWTAPLDPPAGYELVSDHGARAVLGPHSTAHRVAGLQPGTTYTFRVGATHADGRSSVSSAVPLTVMTAKKQPAAARPIDMARLGVELRGAVSVQDRRSGLTKYRACFVGSEAAAWLREWLRHAGFTHSAADAVTLGNQLMDTGLFVHVTKDHIFKDRDLYYRFMDDPDSDAIRSAPVSPADSCDASPPRAPAAEAAEAAAAEAAAAGAPVDAADAGVDDDTYTEDSLRFSLDGAFQDDAGMFDAASFESEFYSDVAPEPTDMPPSYNPAAKQVSRAPAAAKLPPPDASVHLMSTDVTVEFDLHTKTWNHVKAAGIPWIEQPRSLTKDMLQNVPVKGRHSKEEKDAERRAEEILRTPGWIVTRETPLEDLEHLVVVLTKCLERCMHEGTMAWCVGGSLQATLDARGPDGTTSILRFLLCSKADWTGDRKSKIGNTCKFHCGGIRLTNVIVDGKMRAEANLKKCTWLKCCYGKKHYGDPPLIPWCSQCEYQKKLAKRKGGRVPTPEQPLVRGMRNCKISKVRPCNNCIAEIARLRSAGSSVQQFQTCDSCNKLIGKIDRLSQDLVSTNYSMGGMDGGSKKRQKKEVPQGVRTKLKDVMLVIFAELGLKAHAKLLDPILLDALEAKYGAKNVDELWDAHEEARGTLMRLVLRNISMGYHLYQAIQAGSAQLDSHHAGLVRAVNMPDFMTCWNAILVRDGCAMVAYVCDKGLASPAAEIIARKSAHFQQLGISAAASVISDRVDRVVCVDDLAAVEPARRTFGTVPVPLEGSSELFIELVHQEGFEQDAVRWLQNDPSLANWRSSDGKGVLHFSCAARRELVVHHLLRSREFRSLSKLQAFVEKKDYLGKTAEECAPQGAKVCSIIRRKVATVAATTVQKHVRRILGARAARECASAKAQSVADAGLYTDRLRFLAELASTCQDNDAGGAQLWCNQLKDFALETLDLDDLRMTSLPQAICSDSMASLEILSLNNNSLNSLPSDLKCLPFLRSLFVDENDFSVMPDVISEMDSLELLSIRHNKLTTLPTGLLDLAELKDTFAEGNPLEPALAHACNSWPAIREHLQNRRDSTLRDQVYTVVLMGPAGCGKTTLAKALRKPSGTFRSLWARSPLGAPANDWQDLPDLQLSIVDSGDCSMLLSGALPFVSQRGATYVVVCNCAANDWKMELQTWLDYLVAQTAAKSCNVVVACSHAYESPPVDQVAVHSALSLQFPTLNITRVFFMDCRVTKEAQDVRTHLCSAAARMIRSQPDVCAVYPEVHEVAHDLGQSDGPILSVSEVCQAAEKKLGTSSEVTMQAIKYLARRGRLMHLHSGENDAFDVVVPDIAWVDSLLGKVAAAAKRNETPGVVDIATIHAMLTRCSNQDPALLLRLLLKLEVCFPTTLATSDGDVRAVVVPSCMALEGDTVPWPAPDDDEPCVGYSFVFSGHLPPNFFHRLQTRLHVRVDRRCEMSRSSVGLSGHTLGRCGQRAWVRFDREEQRIDVVVIGQHPGPAASIIVAMIQQMQNDEAYPGLGRLCKRYLLCQRGIRSGKVPALIDEEAVADASGDPSLLAAKQRLALARSVLSVASKQRIIAALPSAEDSAALVLQSRPTSKEQLRSMMLLLSDGSLDLAITGMVSIERQPQAVTVLRGDRATLKVQARGAPDLTYQWYRGPLLLQGETSPVIAVTNVRCDDEGSYSCVVSNEVGSVRTASAALSSYVSYPEPVAPPRVDGIVVAAYQLQLSWTAPRAFGEAVVEYRVQLCRVTKGDEVTLPEQTVSGFVSTSATLSELELDTMYRVRIAARNHAGWGSYGAWSPALRTLAVPPPEVVDLSFSTVSALDEMETVVTNPKYSVVAVQDDRASFKVTVRGAAPISLQWYRGSVALPETSSTLTIGSTSSKSAASYSCRISNEFGEVQTPGLQLDVHGQEAVSVGECVTCKTHARLWTLDCNCQLFGVCANCTQGFACGQSRCPRCAGEAYGVVTPAAAASAGRIEAQ